MLRQWLRRHPRLLAASRTVRVALHRWNEWLGTHLSRGQRAVVTPYGFTLYARRFHANRGMQAGAFELDETALLRRHLDAQCVFVDVGANIGYYTAFARQAGAHVVAIEPQPQNLASLYATLLANGWADDARTEVFPLGVGAQPGLLTLYGASGPSASLVRGWAGYADRTRQTIPLTTLDTLLGDRFPGGRLVIKIDVEGAEEGVLRGAGRTLAREPRPVWLGEICLHEFHPSGVNPDYAATFDHFWRHGYAAYTADAAARPVTPVDVARWVAAGRTDAETFNFLFT